MSPFTVYTKDNVEVNARWQEFMAPYFAQLTGAHADQSMAELEEVFHLD